MPEIFFSFVWQCWLVILEMAPYLLFGFALAGLMSIWISPEWTERHLGGKGLGPVVKATLLGIPLPLCSCSVIPVVASMRRHGASRAAATSFLLSTPQTGVDSIAVTYALLGPIFAIFRPIAALVTGVLGGALVLVFGRANSAEADVPPACTDSCCSGDRTAPAWLRAAKYGFVTLPRDLAWPLLAGVAIAGAIAAVFPADSLQRASWQRSAFDSRPDGCRHSALCLCHGFRADRRGADSFGRFARRGLGLLDRRRCDQSCRGDDGLESPWPPHDGRLSGHRRAECAFFAAWCSTGFQLGLSTGCRRSQPARRPPVPGIMSEPGGFWSNLWAVVLMAVLLGSKLPTGGKQEKPAEGLVRSRSPRHACGCGCSDQPLHQLTKK